MDAPKKKKKTSSATPPPEPAKAVQAKPSAPQAAKPQSPPPPAVPAPTPAPPAAAKKTSKSPTTPTPPVPPAPPLPAAKAGKPAAPAAPPAPAPQVAPAAKAAPAPATKVQAKEKTSSPPTPPPPSTKKDKGNPSAPPAPAVPPPSILLEGDASPTPPAGGPGGRYVLSPLPASPSTGANPNLRELPQSYGTRRLLLVARDPHWVYAHWDFTDAQLREANRLSASGTLVLRIRAGTPTAEVVIEQPVHPESRNWFVHVPQAGARYLAELGYFDKAGSWVQVSLSSATLTPRDELSEETWVRFETLPFDIPMTQIVALVKQAIAENTPLLEALQQLRREGFPDLPQLFPVPAAGTPSALPWTPAQEQALARVLCMDEVRRVWIGSLEITELLRRQLQRGISSAGLPLAGPGPAGGESSPGISSLSSPFGGAAPGARGFWFNVNAELVVYGATDPKATVTIGDRTIRLRPDGSFSYRFALPDGEYRLPITATSPDGVEQRQANLDFRRASAYRGEVPPHPQDPSLRTPGPEHVG